MKRVWKCLPILSVFCLALFVRIVYNKTVSHGYTAKYDAAIYDIIAQNLVKYHCFCRFTHTPTVSRAPLWPFVMAAIYSITGPQNSYPRLFYCFLGAGTCLILYFFAKDLFGHSIALFTGLLAATYSGLFIYDGWLFSESLYTFLLTALTYSLYCIERTRKNRWTIISGLLLGLASLTRPNGPTLFGLIILWGLIVGRAKIIPWRSTLKAGLIILCLASMLIAPWTYRNYRVTHSFVLVALGMGDVLLGAYNDTVLQNKRDTGPRFWVPRQMVTPAPPVQHCRDCYNHDSPNYTAENEKMDTDYALHWISTHLTDMPYLLAWHFIQMWKPYTDEVGIPFHFYSYRLSAQIVANLHNIMSICVFLLAACGLLVTWQGYRQKLSIVYLVITLTILQNLAFYANMRFRAPVEPFLVLLVGGALWWITNKEPYTLRARFQQVNVPEKVRSQPKLAGEKTNSGDLTIL